MSLEKQMRNAISRADKRCFSLAFFPRATILPSTLDIQGTLVYADQPAVSLLVCGQKAGVAVNDIRMVPFE